MNQGWTTVKESAEKWLWKRIEPFVQTVVTERVVLFHNAMIERGQILPVESGEHAHAQR